MYVPGGDRSGAEAFARVTHLCVAAHQDDIEIMAQAGISECLDTPGLAFGGVVVTDGSGSPRAGAYAALSDEEMQQVRRNEQRRAAELGRYAVQIQLAHPSRQVKRPGDAAVAADLEQLFHGCRPQVVYLHNPADKHDTHVAVLLRCLDVLRRMPASLQPERVLGCEVWRDLDWLVDGDKVPLDASRHPDLARELLAVFDSQVSGGKRYDLAALGRRRAHATFHTSHATDACEALTWAMDLTPLLRDPAVSVQEFVLRHIERFHRDVAERVAKFGGA